MLLEKLTQAFGVSGSETEIANLIKSELYCVADEITIDALGNLIALKKGVGENKKTIMVCAHMDEIGFCIMNITDKGFVRVRSVGGVSIYTANTNVVKFENGVIGTIVSEGEISQMKSDDITKMLVDIGAKNKEEALKLVKPGDILSFVGPFYQLSSSRVMGKAFDDRAGCYVLIESMKKLKDVYNDINYVFTVQEEVGLRGSRTSSFGINPDIGVVVDITGSFDTPGCSEGNMVLGGGAAIKVMDGSVICDKKLNSKMIQLAKDRGIPYQMDILAGGGTDGQSINMTKNGVSVTGISIPTRYAHTPVSIVDMDDLKASIELLTAFVNEDLSN